MVYFYHGYIVRLKLELDQVIAILKRVRYQLDLTGYGNKVPDDIEVTFSKI